MKKTICIALLASLVVVGLVDCSKKAAKPQPKAKNVQETAKPANAAAPPSEKMALLSKEEVKLSDTPPLLANGNFEKWQAGEATPKGFDPPVGNKSVIRKEMKDVGEGVIAVSQTWQALDGMDSFLKKFGANIEGLAKGKAYTFEVKAKNPSSKAVQVAIWQETGNSANPYERLKDNATIVVPAHTNEFTSFSCPVTPKTDRRLRVFTTCSDKAGEFPATAIWDAWKLTEN